MTDTTTTAAPVDAVVAELLALSEPFRLHLDVVKVLQAHHLDFAATVKVRDIVRAAKLQEEPGSDRADDLRLIVSTVDAHAFGR